VLMPAWAEATTVLLFEYAKHSGAEGII